jgi:hypothetical protein
MSRALAFSFTCTLILLGGATGCATSSAPPAPVLRDPTALQGVIAGQTTRAQLQAALGDGTSIRFDNGVEARLYLTPEAGVYREFVVLIDAAGVVAKTRKGALISPSP